MGWISGGLVFPTALGVVRGGYEKMTNGLVWRALLFFGLTAGYVIVAALPYLA
jgi:hypothetical protein